VEEFLQKCECVQSNGLVVAVKQIKLQAEQTRTAQKPTTVLTSLHSWSYSLGILYLCVCHSEGLFRGCNKTTDNVNFCTFQAKLREQESLYPSRRKLEGCMFAMNTFLVCVVT